MNATQEAQLSMFRAVESHGDANPQIVALVPAFQASFVLFKTQITNLIEAMQKEDLVTKGITVGKSEAKKELCKFASQIASPIFAYAETTGNSQLKNEVNFSYSKLVQTKDDGLVPRVRNIHALGVENLASLTGYGITSQMLDQFLGKIEAYSLKVPNPKNAAAVKKTIRENIKVMMKDTNAILKNQMDKSIVILKATNPDFVSTYLANRVIIDPPKGQTQLKGKIVNIMDKMPIEGATVAIDTFTAVTDVNGKFQIGNMRLGTYNLEVLADGFEQAPQASVLIKQGKINVFAIALKPEKV